MTVLRSDQPIRKAFYFIVLVTLIRLIWLAFRPVGMSSDETYYWDWGRHLDWGYYSKPPMIAWLNGLVDLLGSGRMYGFKVAAALFAGAGTFMLALAAAELFGPAAAFRTALISTAMIGMLAAAAIFNTDGPLMLAWNTSMWLFFRCWKRGGGWREYGALAVVMSFGVLTKQMMLVFPLTALIVLWAAGKGLVSVWKLIAAAMVSVLALTPSIYWNSRHEWITFVHTEHHFQAGDSGVKEMTGRMLDFLGSQAGLITPLLFVVLIACLSQAVLGWRKNRPALAMALFSFPGLLVMVAMVFRQEINPNWPAVFWSGAVALGGARPLGSGKRFPIIAVAVGHAMVLFVMCVTAVTGRLPILKPDKRLWNGWEEAAAAVARRADLSDGKEAPLIIVTGHRFAASQMAFHLPGQPEVFYYDGDPEITSEYDFWRPTAGQMKRPVIVINFGGKALPPELASGLAGLKLKEGGEIIVPIARKNRYRFQVYSATNLNQWPQ